MIGYTGAMRTISYNKARKDLAGTIERVIADREPALIVRKGGKPPAVLMSLEDFASHEETRYLLQSPANAERLLASIASLDQG